MHQCADTRCFEEVNPQDPDVVLAADLVDTTGFGAEARERQWGKLRYFHRHHLPAGYLERPRPDGWA